MPEDKEQSLEMDLVVADETFEKLTTGMKPKPEFVPCVAFQKWLIRLWPETRTHTGALSSKAVHA